MKVQITTLPHHLGLPLPSYATEGSAGLDLPAAEECLIYPGKRMLVPTGIAIALPVNYEAQIRPRSGLANKYGVTVLNAPGTIDSDYRGEVFVLLINHGEGPFLIGRGDRIAQLVIAKVERVKFEESELSETERGTGGFGSSGR